MNVQTVVKKGRPLYQYTCMYTYMYKNDNP